MTSQPSTPPMAQTSTVRMLMGIGGVRNKFVKKRRTIPRMALTRSPPSDLAPPHPHHEQDQHHKQDYEYDRFHRVLAYPKPQLHTPKRTERAGAPEDNPGPALPIGPGPSANRQNREKGPGDKRHVVHLRESPGPNAKRRPIPTLVAAITKPHRGLSAKARGPGEKKDNAPGPAEY